MAGCFPATPILHPLTENPMKFVFETVAESQKEVLAAAGAFTDNLLVVIERLTQLNIEVSRSAVEKTSEITMVCLDGCLAKENALVWSPLLKAGAEGFSEYCRAASEAAQGAKKG
jgi:hypothetical protein